ncbi:MAG: P-loop NTPase [Planctomycetota bacterium]
MDSIEPGEHGLARGDPSPQSRAGPREALSVAIASGKGGTGKSFLATGLGIVASRRGYRCTLVDADFGLAVDHLLLGCQPSRNLQDFLEGRADALQVRTPAVGGLHLVPGATGVAELASPGRAELGRFGVGMSEWGRDADLLLVDTGAGIQAAVVATVAAADVAVFVVQPEIASLTDAYALMKLLLRRPGPAPIFGVVSNRTAGPEVGRASFEKLAEVARKFLGVTLHYLGGVSDEPAVTPRRLGSPPLVHTHPECRTSAEMTAILSRLEVIAGGIRQRARVEGVDSLAARLLRQLPRSN